MSRIRANQITNQSADGAPTVQNGLVVSGVTTSTTFSGSGASLTNLPVGGSNAISLNDNVNLNIGTGNDGSLFNTGSYLFLKNHNGNVAIQASGTGNVISLQKYDNSDIGLQYVVDGALKLYHDNVSMLETEARGAFVKKADGGETFFFVGSTNAGGVRLALDGDSNGDGTGNDYAFLMHDTSGDFIISADNPAGNSNLIFKAGNSSEKVRINTNGGVGIGTNNFGSKLNNQAGLAIHGSANDNCRISFTTPTKSNPGSSIGYFGLNRFGIDTYDGIEMRDVTRSYATIFKIDQNGYMTTKQPYGYIRFNTHNDNGLQRQTNVNTHTVENGMSHSSGRLTVPAAGKYYIGIHSNILDDNAAAQYLYINGSRIDGWNWQQSDSTSYWKSSMVSGVYTLQANDYLDVYVTGKQDNASWNMFTVYMLG